MIEAYVVLSRNILTGKLKWPFGHIQSWDQVFLAHVHMDLDLPFLGETGIRIGFWDLLHVQEISLEGKGLFIQDDLEAMMEHPRGIEGPESFWYRPSHVGTEMSNAPHGPGFGKMLWP